MRPPRQPYALDTPTFAFAAIAVCAARAPLGGSREIVLASYVTARLANDVNGDVLAGDARRARALNARRWLSTLALADPVRRAFLDLIAATETDAPATAAALRRVMEVTSGVLDAPSHAELDRLVTALGSQTVAGT